MAGSDLEDQGDGTGREDLDDGLIWDDRRLDGCLVAIGLSVVLWAVIAAVVVCAWP